MITRPPDITMTTLIVTVLTASLPLTGLAKDQSTGDRYRIIVPVADAPAVVNSEDSAEQQSERKSAADRALLMAAETGNAELAAFALERGANPDVRDESDDQTPGLLLATRAGSQDIVRILLENNASPDISSRTGLTALMQAARSSQNNIARLLLDADAQIDLQDERDGYTALLHAAAAGTQAMLILLLESNANVNIQENSRGLTALMLAAARRTGFPAVIDLIAAGADINATANDGWTALMAAINENNHDATEVLLLNGADSLAQTGDDRSAFSLAARSGSPDAIRLLTGGIDAKKFSPVLGQSLHAAALSGNVEITEHLLSFGADSATRNASGHTVLHSAVLGGHANIVETLLAHDADPDLLTETDGHTALMLAANRDMLVAVKHLLSAGANVEIVARDGWTAIQAAEMIGATEIIEALDSRLSN